LEKKEKENENDNQNDLPFWLQLTILHSMQHKSNNNTYYDFDEFLFSFLVKNKYFSFFLLTDEIKGLGERLEKNKLNQITVKAKFRKILLHFISSSHNISGTKNSNFLTVMFLHIFLVSDQFSASVQPSF
jgi:hypothetical protein